MSKTLLKRIVTSTLLTGLTAYILFFKSPLYFAIEVAFFVAFALHEFFSLLKDSGVPVNRFFGISMGVTLPAMVYLEFGMTQSGDVLFLIFGCLFLFLLQFFRKEDPQALIGISLTLFGILYVSWFLSYLIRIRFMEGGVIWIAYLLLVTKFQDIGAYLVGTKFGRHKLIPHISPKKSVEGAIGGLLGSIIVSLLLRPYLPLSFGWVHALLLGAAIGVIGQIGDLSESLMKRCCHAKDSGAVLPGMGGFLDAVDSVLFTAPLFYFHLKIYL